MRVLWEEGVHGLCLGRYAVLLISVWAGDLRSRVDTPLGDPRCRLMICPLGSDGPKKTARARDTYVLDCPIARAALSYPCMVVREIRDRDDNVVWRPSRYDENGRAWPRQGVEIRLDLDGSSSTGLMPGDRVYQRDGALVYEELDPTRADRYRDALRAIVGPSDSMPWIAPYRDAGGGYEGLQAIARSALGEAGS